MSRILSIIGVVVTGVYLVALVILFKSRIAEIHAMPPNNIGDFLAGIFGPLAIFWLILGFFQQGIELRQNTHALDLQADELRNSVEQQKQLVEVSRKQVEAELEVIRFERERQKKSARPIFVFHGVGAMFSGPEGTYSSRIKNIGNTATEIEFSYDPPIKQSSLTKVFSWSRGEEQGLEWKYKTPVAESRTVLIISYVDSSGIPGTQLFQFIPVKDEGGPNTMVEVKPWPS